MSTEERSQMIDGLNNTSQNKKIMETFFNISGRRPSEEEMKSLEQNIYFQKTNTDNVTDIEYYLSDKFVILS